MMSSLRVYPFIFLLLGVSGAPVLSAQGSDELHVVLRAGTGVFVSGSQAEPDGFDVELLQRFVAWQKSRRGSTVSYRITFVNSLNELLSKAETDQCDMALGSVTATPERDKRVDFSDPYLPVRIVVMARAGRLSPGGSQNDLSGKTIGAIQGSTHAKALEALQRDMPDLSMKLDYTTAESLFSDFLKRNSELDAATTDLTHYWVIKKTEDIELVTSLGPEQGLAFVLPNGSELREPLNEFLDYFTHNQSYFSLVRKYFGQEADDMIRMARKK
jgi:polar amino acid transport system substrate-binding protein